MPSRLCAFKIEVRLRPSMLRAILQASRSTCTPLELYVNEILEAAAAELRLAKVKPRPVLPPKGPAPPQAAFGTDGHCFGKVDADEQDKIFHFGDDLGLKIEQIAERLHRSPATIIKVLKTREGVTHE